MSRIRDEVMTHVDHPSMVGLRNYTWTMESIRAWEDIWNTLWKLGYKWEWQNADRYARRRGETYQLFGCYNDAAKLDMAIPLPEIHVIEEVRELLLDSRTNDTRIGHAIGAIDAWLKEHYAS